jgi:predicted  nucleic acid-binding Zn-ribbon protein
LTLDPEILKRAMQIINNRSKQPEMEEVKKLLTLNNKKLEEYERRFDSMQMKLEAYETRFDSMEKSWKETEVLLEKILSKIEFSTSNNSSSK